MKKRTKDQITPIEETVYKTSVSMKRIHEKITLRPEESKEHAQLNSKINNYVGKKSQ